MEIPTHREGQESAGQGREAIEDDSTLPGELDVSLGDGVSYETPDKWDRAAAERLREAIMEYLRDKKITPGEPSGIITTRDNPDAKIGERILSTKTLDSDRLVKRDSSDKGKSTFLKAEGEPADSSHNARLLEFETPSGGSVSIKWIDVVRYDIRKIPPNFLNNDKDTRIRRKPRSIEIKKDDGSSARVDIKYDDFCGMPAEIVITDNKEGTRETWTAVWYASNGRGILEGQGIKKAHVVEHRVEHIDKKTTDTDTDVASKPHSFTSIHIGGFDDPEENIIFVVAAESKRAVDGTEQYAPTSETRKPLASKLQHGTFDGLTIRQLLDPDLVDWQSLITKKR